MEVIPVPSWVDFREDLIYAKSGEKTFIPTPVPNIVLRVTKRYDGFLVTIENTDFPEEVTFNNYEDRVMGIVNLLTRKYDGLGPVFEPHSFLDAKYRGNGYVESIYRWVLDSGFTLVSGENQTKYSNGLWKKLAKDYEFNVFDIYNHCIHTENVYDMSDYNIRLMLRKKND
jgi:hypothetical protein